MRAARHILHFGLAPLTILLVLLASADGQGGPEKMKMPSGAMLPTLAAGAELTIEKISANNMRAGDIVAFKFLGSGAPVGVGRVIGLPGDQIQFRQATLFINGLQIPRLSTDFYLMAEEGGPGFKIPQFVETLPNGTSFKVLYAAKFSMSDTGVVHSVPTSHWFIIGDNRSDAVDSRQWMGAGYVSADRIIGRVKQR